MTRISRLTFGLLALLIVGNATAQTSYPEKPIRMVVGFPPGGAPDTVARLLGQKLSEALRQPVVMDNATGAGGNIATERVARAAPDGYTVGFLVNGQLVINPSLYKLAFDPARDLAPISQVTVTPNMLVVNPAVPAKNLQELIRLAKAKPGELTFASGGTGTGNHMAAELFKSVAGLDIRHIPYKGVLAAVPDLLGGRVTMMFSPLPVVLPLVREGKLRAIAVTSLTRSSSAPELPTIAESGYPGFEAIVWFGLFAPTGTPPEIVRKISEDTARVLATPAMRELLAGQGADIVASSPAVFTTRVNAEIGKWRKVIQDAGIKPE